MVVTISSLHFAGFFHVLQTKLTRNRQIKVAEYQKGLLSKSSSHTSITSIHEKNSLKNIWEISEAKIPESAHLLDVASGPPESRARYKIHTGPWSLRLKAQRSLDLRPPRNLFCHLF